MKKVILMLVILSIIFFSYGSMQITYAHGVIYEQTRIGENTLRVTLKWSNPAESKGIEIKSYSVKNGKYINIAYETVDGKPSADFMDFDLKSFLPPVSIKLYNIKEYDKPLFTDVKGHYAESYIHHLHDAGVVSGRPDGSFAPNSPVSRAEFMTLMVKALKLEGTAENTKGYTDIDNHWAKNIILVAAKNGLISGYLDKTIRPDNPITLAEVSAVISRAFAFKTQKNGVYSKLKQGMWYSSYVKKMFDSGILKTEDNIYNYNFDEQGNMNRANCAVMISRALSTY